MPWTLRNYANNQVGILNITDLTNVEPWASSSSSHTDVIRLRQGKVGAQVNIYILTRKKQATVFIYGLIVLGGVRRLHNPIQRCCYQDMGTNRRRPSISGC